MRKIPHKVNALSLKERRAFEIEEYKKLVKDTAGED